MWGLMLSRMDLSSGSDSLDCCRFLVVRLQTWALALQVLQHIS